MENQNQQNLKFGKKNSTFYFLLSIFYLFLLSTFYFLNSEFVLAEGASFYLAPSQGTFFVGSTFSISIELNTKGNEINAVELDLKFPPDVLQVTTPTAGESFITEWLTPPNYSNLGGTISFKGGIPGGISTSAGLVSTITFRAKSVGLANVEILDSSRVLLKDERGTPILTNNIGGRFEILIPPPEGPKIISLTHPDPNIWYADSNVSFSWEKEEAVTDFSYSFSQNPQEIPDTVSEGTENFKTFEEVADGIWYFHLRQNKSGVWGKASHIQVRIDTTPPQKFKIEPELYTGFIYFETKDVNSGIGRYEVSVINLEQLPNQMPFFVEAASPYKIPYKEGGRYRAEVRAYDKAGNFETASIEFQKLLPFISLVAQRGIQIKGFFISRSALILLLFSLSAILGYSFLYLTKSRTGFKKGIKEIKEALREIEKIKEKERRTQILRDKFKEEKEKLEDELKKPKS